MAKKRTSPNGLEILIADLIKQSSSNWSCYPIPDTNKCEVFFTPPLPIKGSMPIIESIVMRRFEWSFILSLLPSNS